VGTAGDNGRRDAPVAERWNGRKWAIQHVPTPAGTPRWDWLSDVSCTSATWCIAVGVSGNQTLAERWDGKSWRPLRTPTRKDSELIAVSCVSSRACVAVGDFNPDSGTQLTLAERWNGKSWTLQRISHPAGVTQSMLTGVSCPTEKSCMAVGEWDSGRALAERWNGREWKIQRLDPRGATSSLLNTVSCSSATTCTAVGFSTHGYDGSLREVPLAERWNHSMWTIQPTPKVSAVSGLVGVSCVSATACTAVGSSSTSPAGRDQTMAERWDGTKWTIQRTPTEGRLIRVSCASRYECTAVGAILVNSFNSSFKTLTEHWTG
jgi:hypothetical protein